MLCAGVRLRFPQGWAGCETPDAKKETVCTPALHSDAPRSTVATTAHHGVHVTQRADTTCAHVNL